MLIPGLSGEPTFLALADQGLIILPGAARGACLLDALTYLNYLPATRLHTTGFLSSCTVAV